MSSVVTERAIECKSDVCSLWTVLADTERMNQLLGLDKISVRPLSDVSAARYLATTDMGGFTVEYEERPFEWVYPQAFKIYRRMRTGPLHALEMAIRLKPNESGGTTVTVRLTLTPRYGIMRPFLRFMGARTLKKYERAVAELDEGIAAGKAPPAPRKSAVHADALDHAGAALKKMRPDDPAVDRLVAWVRDEGDADVSRIRPFALADLWKLDRRDVLATSLAGVRAGLLELRWEIVCPSCRTATDTLPSLSSLQDHAACQLCEIDFAVDLEEAVEATFAPTRAIREVDSGPYCIGGPARTPHVIAQAVLPPHGEASIFVPADTGKYRLFVRGGAATQVEVMEGKSTEEHVDAASVGVTPKIEVAPEGVVRITNASGEERHAKLEQIVWSSTAAKAHFVTTMPGFRRDFSTDILRPGTALKVAKVGIFFSDLTGSTQLYTDAGDAAAFRLVQDHFDVVIGLIEKNHGTLVKTIGDAVMAVFADDLDGLVASLDILRAFDAFRREHDEGHQTHIKLGVYGGSCYVVTANGTLDYFGQSVNIAARLQAEAKSGEIVVEADLADRAIARGLLSVTHVIARYDAVLKGVAKPISVARLGVVT